MLVRGSIGINKKLKEEFKKHHPDNSVNFWVFQWGALEYQERCWLVGWLVGCLVGWRVSCWAVVMGVLRYVSDMKYVELMDVIH